MRAVVCRSFNDAIVKDVPRPEPEPDEVLIEVHRVQLSVTECNLFRGEAVRHRGQVERRFNDGEAKVFGHEFCGTIVEVGDGVKRFSPGDRVYAPGKIPCFECSYCQNGFPHFCKNTVGIGYDRPGGLAEYFTLPESPLQTLPAGISNAEGAAMQPLASSVLAVNDADVSLGDVVAIVGIGVMGSQCGQVALECGASEVFAIDIVPEKLEIAERNGMTPIHATDEDPVERVRSETDGIGADVVFEAVGGPQERMALAVGTDPIAQALDMVRTGGTILQVGHLFGDLTVTPKALRSKKVTWEHPRSGRVLTGPNNDTGRIAPQLVADGRVSISEYITHELNGLDSFEEAVDITLDNDVGLGPAQIIVSG